MKRYQLSITIFFLLCALLPGFAQQTKTLTLLQTSDTHSRIEPIDVCLLYTSDAADEL